MGVFLYKDEFVLFYLDLGPATQLICSLLLLLLLLHAQTNMNTMNTSEKECHDLLYRLSLERHKFEIQG